MRVARRAGNAQPTGEDRGGTGEAVLRQLHQAGPAVDRHPPGTRPVRNPTPAAAPLQGPRLPRRRKPHKSGHNPHSPCGEHNRLAQGRSVGRFRGAYGYVEEVRCVAEGDARVMEQVRLNEIVSGSEVRAKRRGALHTLSNSLKRNTVYGSMGRAEEDYESRLPNVNFTRKDLSLMLRYLLYKQQMQISDRNLLRRILLSTFDEGLVSAGGKGFVQHLSLLPEDVFTVGPKERRFYFLLRGRARVRSGGVSYEIKEGGVFGEVQILADVDMQSIEFSGKFLVLVLGEQHFDSFFRKYFERMFEERQEQLSSIWDSHLSRISPLRRFLMLQKLEYRNFDIGDTIVLAGQRAVALIFLGDDWLGPRSPHLQHACIGLYEAIKQRPTYTETYYCVDQKCTLPWLPREVFLKYMNSEFSKSEIAQESFVQARSSSMLENPEVKVDNFLRVRRVKLLMNNNNNRSRLRTEPDQCREASFRFIKPDPLLATWKDRRNYTNIDRRENRSFVVKATHE